MEAHRISLFEGGMGCRLSFDFGFGNLCLRVCPFVFGNQFIGLAVVLGLIV